jgi:hypothetical protein
MGKRILYLIFFILIITKINSQEIKFSWSLGDFGWGYNFIGGHEVLDVRILKFNVAFEQINVMINTSVFWGKNKNNHEDTEPYYNSFFPLEIIYSPFKWEYVHISLYGRGAWEIGYIGDNTNSQKISDGFFGALGFRVGLIPIQSNFFKYASHVVNIYSEYTIRNEFKLGISIDLLDIVFLGLKIWSSESKATGENNK